MTLNAIWFILVFVLLSGYAVLDGFDLGVGILYLFHREDRTRRIFLNAIGPVWDGNEVWLLTGGGALFAAFPIVYATVFSGFYLALMVVLACLIFRAVAMEFRGKVNSPTWRAIWDYAFGISSLLLALLFGVAFGNVLRGITLAPDGTYAGTFFDLLNPYALLVGILGLLVFFLHGSIYLAGKTDGPTQSRLIAIAKFAWVLVATAFVAVTIATTIWAPSLTQAARVSPLIWCFSLLLLVSAIFIPIALNSRRLTQAFIASIAMICSLMGLAAIGLFPRLLPCLNDPSATLTIYNASSSARTLRVMFIIALIGMPLVIAYTASIYHIFRGKITITADSY